MVSGIRSQKFIDSDFGEIHRALGLASGQISQYKFRGNMFYFRNRGPGQIRNYLFDLKVSPEFYLQ